MVLRGAPITTITGNQKAIEFRQPSHIGWPLLQQQYQRITTRDGNSFIDQILSIRTSVVSDMQEKDEIRRKEKKKKKKTQEEERKVKRNNMKL